MATPTQLSFSRESGGVTLNVLLDGNFEYTSDIVGLNGQEASSFFTGTKNKETVSITETGYSSITQYSPASSIKADSEMSFDEHLEKWSGDDYFVGDQETPRLDSVYGYAGNDTFVMTYSDNSTEKFNGGDGLDTAKILSESEHWRVNLTDTAFDSQTGLSNLSGYYFVDTRHTDTDIYGDFGHVLQLVDVERVEFTDTNLALDTEGATSAGGIYRLYKATFNREPDKSGLGYWIAQADSGLKSATQMAEEFTWSSEFQELYDITTSDNYGTGVNVSNLVSGFYQNVLSRAPDQEGLNYYTGVIQSKEKTVGRVLAEISDSPENYTNTIGLINKGIQYDLWSG